MKVGELSPFFVVRFPSEARPGPFHCFLRLRRCAPSGHPGARRTAPQVLLSSNIH